MKSVNEIKKAIEGLNVAYDMSKGKEWYERTNHYIEALKWVIGE